METGSNRFSSAVPGFKRKKGREKERGNRTRWGSLSQEKKNSLFHSSNIFIVLACSPSPLKIPKETLWRREGSSHCPIQYSNYLTWDKVSSHSQSKLKQGPVVGVHNWRVRFKNKKKNVLLAWAYWCQRNFKSAHFWNKLILWGCRWVIFNGKFVGLLIGWNSARQIIQSAHI